MDTFIDKLAQKRNAQEMILANMTAEAAKMEQMQNQMKAYDELMQEIRQVNLKTAANLSEVQNMLKEYTSKLESMQDDSGRAEETRQMLDRIEGILKDNSRDEEFRQVLNRIKELLEDNSRNEETVQALNRIKELLEDSSRNEETVQALTQLREVVEEKFRQSDDYLHKENVKVYRNVQAAVAEELSKQTEELKKSQQANRGSKAVLPISILILLAVLADIAVHLLGITIPM